MNQTDTMEVAALIESIQSQDYLGVANRIACLIDRDPRIALWLENPEFWGYNEDGEYIGVKESDK